MIPSCHIKTELKREYLKQLISFNRAFNAFSLKGKRPVGTSSPNQNPGRQTLTLPLVIFSDEKSGNRSKKWNQIKTYSMFLASLPRKEITKFSNIHFICASNLVYSITLGKEIATDLRSMYILLISAHENSTSDITIY
jgi:hypothetical protein